MKVDIRNIWHNLESNSTQRVTREKVSTTSPLDCYIGVIVPTGAKIFQLELVDIPDASILKLKRFQGVEIQIIRKDQRIQEYTIILLDGDLTDIFVLFIEDVIDSLNDVSDPQNALLAINRRVNYWRKLFARATGDRLTLEQQRGLFGELYFLHYLLSNSQNKEDTLRSWHGSARENQDFIKDKQAIEIKTTKANTPKVNISNEAQLDYTQWTTLFLGVIIINESKGKKNTLCELIREIRELLNFDPVLLNEFDSKVDAAGIAEDEIDQFSETSYVIRSLKYFKIEDGFPIIIRRDLLSDSISQVQYKIDISSCKKFEVPEEQILNSFNE